MRQHLRVGLRCRARAVDRGLVDARLAVEVVDGGGQRAALPARLGELLLRRGAPVIERLDRRGLRLDLGAHPLNLVDTRGAGNGTARAAAAQLHIV
jgi:hypothetical protein